MIRQLIKSIALLLLLIGHSYVLHAQCAAGCSRTTQYNLNEVVICHKGDCGEDGSFSLSRSASQLGISVLQIISLKSYPKNVTR